MTAILRSVWSGGWPLCLWRFGTRPTRDIGAKSIGNRNLSKHWEHAESELFNSHANQDRIDDPSQFSPAVFRTVQELTDFGDDIQPGECIYWSAEYIARGTQWYHFNGCGRYGEWDAVGQASDLQTRLLTMWTPNS